MAVALEREVDLFGVGSSLREARLRRGIALEQVEADTCIRVANLEAIEDERFDELPGDVYGAAFVREYAQYLGLDAPRFVEVFKEARAYEPAPIVHEAVTTLSPPSRAPWLVLGGLVAVAAAAGVFLFLRDAERPSPAPPPAVPVQKTAKPKPAPPSGPLVLRATGGDSWVVVRFGSARGTLVWQGTLRQGTMLRFGLGKQLWVGLGKPTVVTARVDGERVRLNPNVSHFVFGRR